MVQNIMTANAANRLLTMADAIIMTFSLTAEASKYLSCILMVFMTFDVETEQQIQEAINNISGKRTIIAIAHRLSTIRGADQILVVEDGRIVERGTHDELISQGGAYARMNRIQS